MQGSHGGERVAAERGRLYHHRTNMRPGNTGSPEPAPADPGQLNRMFKMPARVV
jgi:hypothetical protein